MADSPQQQESFKMSDADDGKNVSGFSVASISAGLSGPVGYAEFLNSTHLRCGIYQLGAGAEDPQSPHDEDEIYYVIAGRGKRVTDNGILSAGAGEVLYIGAGVRHRFESIEEALTLLVVFAR
jgi:mannose-6-phosphate isomerase-like protein (cupin superfamily)